MSSREVVVQLTWRKSQSCTADVNDITDVTRVPLTQNRPCLLYVDTSDFGKCVKSQKSIDRDRRGENATSYLVHQA